MSKERALDESPRLYRLCKKASGALVLQGGFAWVEIDDDLSETTGIDWRDVRTEVEPFSLARDVMVPVALLLLARECADGHVGDGDKWGQIAREVVAGIDELLKPNVAIEARPALGPSPRIAG